MIVTHRMAVDAAILLGIGLADGLCVKEDVERAFREAAKTAHPDSGGTAEKFAAIDRAKHILLKWLEKGEPATPVHKQNNCVRCEGKGFVISQRAFRQMRVSCPLCRGTGDADYEHERSDTGVNR